MKKKEALLTADQLTQEWYAMPEGQAKQIKLDTILQLITDYYMDTELADALGEFWIKDWPKFNPTLCPLSAYLRKHLPWRLVDLYRQDTNAKRKVETDPETGEKKAVTHWDVSGDADKNGDDEDARTILDSSADSNAEVAYEDALIDGRAYDCVALILSLPERLQGKANNPARLNYFRLFFTDGFSKFLRGEKTTEPFIKHERDIFQAMKLPFLDFYMAECYRSVKELAYGRLKKYGELVEGRPAIDIAQPLANDIYIAYLQRVERRSDVNRPSAVTQQRQAYRQFMKENLC